MRQLNVSYKSLVLRFCLTLSQNALQATTFRIFYLCRRKSRQRLYLIDNVVVEVVNTAVIIALQTVTANKCAWVDRVSIMRWSVGLLHDDQSVSR